MERINVNGTEVCRTVADLKVRIAEHIVAQYDYEGINDAWDIMTETKVGAWRKPALLKILREVFSAA